MFLKTKIASTQDTMEDNTTRQFNKKYKKIYSEK